ncbi:EamA-like transporter family protein [Pseudoruegeria aquimaris]|uniref:EamA-like transporter family protein n=1 Tax=Pseudoruegeria aquimaris TaxID=393663 RepID=A0A1Y5SEZ1_9RHOB|nr:DMT family transporter [Pseudoruegeria aquimaris]SLN36429.1 EamA-like transporter family protein [Pseudoruegeria aquimaris]
MSKILPGGNVTGAVFALAAYGIFSTHDVIVKFLGGTYSPFQILFFSGLLGFPLLVLMLIGDPDKGTLRPVHPWWMLLRTAASMASGLGAFYAFSVLPLAQVYAIIFAAPLLITILAIPILGESVGLHRWAAVIVGLCGVLIVLRPGGTTLELGHAAALLCAVGGALNSVIVRKIGHEERSAVLLLFPMLANFIVLGAVLPFIYVPMPIEHFGGFALIAAMALLATFCLILAYRHGEAVIVAPMQYSQIIWASVYGLIFFNETLDGPTALGAGVIILSGLYILFRESRGKTSKTTPVLRTRTRSGTGNPLRVGPYLRAAQRRGQRQQAGTGGAPSRPAPLPEE